VKDWATEEFRAVRADAEKANDGLQRHRWKDHDGLD